MTLTFKFPFTSKILEDCCTKIILDSTGIQRQVGSEKLGTYVHHASFNGRPAYKLDTNDFYLHWSVYKTWSVRFMMQQKDLSAL